MCTVSLVTGAQCPWSLARSVLGHWRAVSLVTGAQCPWSLARSVLGHWRAVSLVTGAQCPWSLARSVLGHWRAVSLVTGAQCPWSLARSVLGHWRAVSLVTGAQCPWTLAWSLCLSKQLLTMEPAKHLGPNICNLDHKAAKCIPRELQNWKGIAMSPDPSLFFLPKGAWLNHAAEHNQNLQVQCLASL